MTHEHPGTASLGDVRDLLSDFEFHGFGPLSVIMPSRMDEETKRSVHAALAASMLGLRSIDYARKRYTDSETSESSGPFREYVATYREVDDYVCHILGRFSSTAGP